VKIGRRGRYSANLHVRCGRIRNVIGKEESGEVMKHALAEKGKGFCWGTLRKEKGFRERYGTVLGERTLKG